MGKGIAEGWDRERIADGWQKDSRMTNLRWIIRFLSSGIFILINYSIIIYI